MSDYENERLHALRQLNLLDTPPSECFDRITRMAAQLFDLPISAVSLTDEERQWFKSRVGVDLWEVPREKSPCSEVSCVSEVLIIEDFLASDFYRNSPQAQIGLRCYAGAPLITRHGYVLGTMCVLGYQPREFSDDEISMLKDLAAMVMAQIELQHALGRVDATTNLPNRCQFTEDVKDMARDFPGETRYALFVELADVVQLNTLSRVMGPTYVDELSRNAARELTAWLPAKDALYALGPCQYLFLRQARDEKAVEEEAFQLNENLKLMNQDATLPLTVRPVIGIAPFTLGQTEADDVLRIAHGACQDARQKEAVASVYCRALDAGHQRRWLLARDMRNALDSEGELRLVYQPRVALSTGLCIGAEALLRWNHPVLGEVSPYEFIPLIESTPLADSLTAWVMDAAIAQSAEWYHKNLRLRISANVMAANLEDQQFTTRLLDSLGQSGLPMSAFELELTESSLISNNRSVNKQLEQLMSSGIRVAIDDFGTGYSSLAYLMKIPANVVKIDRAFTRRQEPGERSETLLKTMLTLAHELGYQTVAEGFTPLDMLQTLTGLGCDEVQSFEIARPMAPGDFEAWLDRFQLNTPRMQPQQMQ